MSHIRFNHLFFFLMLLATLSACFSPRVSEAAQRQLQLLFSPIARPIRSMGGWTREKVSPEPLRDDGSPGHPRELKEILRENTDLRAQIIMVTDELNRLKEVNADRNKLGDLRSRCTPVAVSAGDSGSRETLLLSAGSLDGLRKEMPVLCPDGVVGKLTLVGAKSSRVRLITDKGNKVKVNFARFDKDTSGVTNMFNISYPDSIAIGQGGRQMLVTNQRWEDLKKNIKINDWAVLNDPDWSRLSYRVGRVSAIEPQPGAMGFGQIKIESVVDLNLLSEVMVLTR